MHERRLHPGRRVAKTARRSSSSTCPPSGHAPCVENRRWTLGGVTYATLNIQGSCNNLCDTAPGPAEFAARNAADIAWLQETFAVAKQRHSAAIMLISHADLRLDLPNGSRVPL